MTENELRQKVVDIAVPYIGATKGSAKHIELINIYNAHTPLARGYAVKPTDDYCATAVSAYFIKAGLADIFPLECGCGEAVKIASNKGIWVENDAYIPKKGDAVLMDWQDTGSGDNTGWPDHIMLIRECDGKTIRCVNSNDGNHGISDYSIPVNAQNIRGFITPNFAIMATEETKEVKIAKYKTTTDLNMRSGAGITNKVLLTIPGNAEVEATGETKVVLTSVWYEVIYKGVIGWVNSKYLSFVADVTKSDIYYTAITDLNMRSGAGITNKVLLTIKENDVQNKVIGTGNSRSVLGSEWLEIVYKDVTGWANGKYLRRV